MDGSTEIPSLEELLGEERWLQALARRLVRDAATADDLVQETWFRALRAGGGRAAGGVADARAWLGRVLRNVWRERGRSERARGRREEHAAASEALPSARESLERVELAQRLASLVLELDEPYRSIVVWRYYENRSAAAIATELGEPAARVRWRLMRARELLRERLERERGDWAARYALFLPLARRAPASAGAAATGAAGIGVLTMAGKTLLWVGAAALLAWTLVRAGNRPSEPSSAALALVEPAPVAAPAAEPGLRAPTQQAERTPLPPTEAPAAGAEGAARVADPFASLRGTVRAAEDGRALADAEVALFEPDGGSLRARTRVAADGTFRLAGLEPGTFDIACRLDGRQPRRVPAPELVAGQESELALELELGFPVTVQVLEHPSGAPLAEAAVELMPGEQSTIVWLRPDDLAFRSLRGVTGPDGRAELGGGARGVYQYVVRAPGHAAALGEALLEPDAATLRISVQRGGIVHGSVRHAGGAPAEGARVFLNSVEYEVKLVFRQNGLAADRDGRYRLEGVPPGIYYAVALLPDGSGVFHFDPEDENPRALGRLVVEDATEVPLDFRLPTPGHVRGRVLDPDGAPIAGARVHVSWGDFKPGRAGFFAIADVEGVKQSIHHSTRSDEAGVFELANLRLSHEPLELNVSATGFVEGELELDMPEGARLEPVVTLRALGATIGGRLTDLHGDPIAGQSVGCFESDGKRLGAFFQTKSGADGRYELRVAATGGGGALHRVQPIVRDSSPYRSEPELREGIPAGARDVDFVLHPRRPLAGFVVDDAGTPVRDFIVHALETGPEPSWEECDDANRGEGRFELHLDASEIAQLRFSAPGCDPAALTDLSGGGERRVVLRRAADLEGVLRDATGRGVAGAVVALATLDSAIYPRGTGFAPRDTTDAEGRFRLRGVPDPSLVPGAPPAGTGHVLVCPQREDAPALLRFALPVPRPARLELVLPRSVPVELAFTDAHGRPIEGGVFVLDEAGWPNEPAAETHLADQASPTRGVLVDGRTRLHLLPGAHHAILVLGTEARESFPFAVADPGAGEATLQTHAFTAGAR